MIFIVLEVYTLPKNNDSICPLNDTDQPPGSWTNSEILMCSLNTFMCSCQTQMLKHLNSV